MNRGNKGDPVREQLRDLGLLDDDQAAPPKAKRGPKPAAASANGEMPYFALTDTGNGQRLAHHFGADFRHCWPWKKDFVWDGRRWCEDSTGQADRWAKETARRIFREAEAANDDAVSKALAAHAVKAQDAKRIRAMIMLARSELNIPITPEGMDADPFLLNVLNGTIDLRTGQMREHRREDGITKLAPVVFRAKANPQRCLQFLARIMDGNQDLLTYLQRVVGYALTGDVREQCLWFFHGAGSNGKTTFLMTVLGILGDYGMQAPSELLMVKSHDCHPTERADLLAKRFVATIETEEGKRMAESLMKQMTGGDKIRARRMREDFWEFTPTHKIFLAANHKPVVRGTDLAVWRRIKLVPFTVTITDEEKDKCLVDKLRTELPGILAWAVRGCLDWQRLGLGEPEEVRQATAEYQAEQDSLAGFLSECCRTHADLKVKASALFEAYAEWSGDKLMTHKGFTQRMRDKGFDTKRGHGGSYFWQGIGLADASGEPG
jgi:putative DNA primase/helicase